MLEHVKQEINTRSKWITTINVSYRTHTQKLPGTAAQEDDQNSTPDACKLTTETFPLQYTPQYHITQFLQKEQYTLYNGIKNETT